MKYLKVNMKEIRTILQQLQKMGYGLEKKIIINIILLERLVYKMTI